MQLLKNEQQGEIKKSWILNKSKQSKLSLSFIDIKHKIAKTSNTRQAQNFTTHDNSLAKNDKVSKSMIQTEGSNRSYSRERQPSHSKRKKFISMTQRKNQNRSDCSQQLNNSQRKLHNVTKFQSDTKINVLNSHEPSAPTSLRQYLSALVSKISPLTKIETEQPSSENKQQKIMNEDVCLDQKQSQTVEKVKREKNRISKLLQTDRHKKIKTQIQMEESFHVQNHKRLTTQTQYPFASRNLMIFEQKIGHNTLTRKDSLIHVLTQISDLVQENLWSGKPANKDNDRNIQAQFPEQGNKKSLQKQCQPKPLKELQLKSLAQEKISQKPSKIKFISLIQRQQSYRYRNNLSNNELKDQFINFKSKIQKKKSSD